MLRALVQDGVQPDFVVGSSVGAINAVQFAADPTPEGVGHLERIWRIQPAAAESTRAAPELGGPPRHAHDAETAPEPAAQTAQPSRAHAALASFHPFFSTLLGVERRHCTVTEPTIWPPPGEKPVE
ncbi:MAG: hypothetical protein ACREMW_02400 [Gemmatimonadales bacterium]